VGGWWLTERTGSRTESNEVLWTPKRTKRIGWVTRATIVEVAQGERMAHSDAGQCGQSECDEDCHDGRPEPCRISPSTPPMRCMTDAPCRAQ
jgi:hypothetical protein